jgi:hypothetical protein
MTTHTSTPSTVHTATPILDQNGRVAQLHGVGVMLHEGRYYAWGEEKSNGSLFTSVECYSTDDFAQWRHEGSSLVGSDDGDLAAGRIVERPKVLFNALTGKYVMFLHIDSSDYKDAHLGFASSDTLTGPYEYHGSSRPLGNISRDIGVFQDPSGLGILLSEDRENGLHLYRLAPDYLSVESILSTTLKADGSHGYESPTLVLHDGLYYLFGSDLTGWNTNDNKYATATSLEGPWSAWRDFAPAGTCTFDSQVSVIVPVAGSEQTSYVYIGDRWNKDDLFNSIPVILPITIGGGDAILEWHDSWSIDTLTGTTPKETTTP